VIPLVLNAALVSVLLLFSLFGKGSTVETFFLTLLLVLLVLVVLECFFREVTITPEGMVIKKLLRSKTLGWGDITDVGAMVLRKKVYLVLTTTKGFHIISNVYDHFTSLVQGVVRHVDAERIEDQVNALIENPVRKMADVISAWVGVVVLLGVFYVKNVL